MERFGKLLTLIFSDKCNVYGKERYEDENYATVEADVNIYTDLPCRLSYGSSPSLQLTAIQQQSKITPKLYYDKDITLCEGYKIEVFRQGAVVYRGTIGVPLKYETHYEVCLEVNENGG